MSLKSLILTMLSLILLLGCGQSTVNKPLDAARYLELGKFASAEKLINEISGSDSLGAEALFGQAQLLEYQGLKWDALMTYTEAAQKQRGNIKALTAFTRLAIDLESYENADQICKILIEREPQNATPHIFQTEIYLAQDMLDSARDALQKAESLGEDEKIIELYRARIDFQTYDTDLINDALGRIQNIKPETTDHFRLLADLYYYLYQPDSTIYYMEKAVATDPDNVILKLQLSKYLYELADYNRALDIALNLIETSEKQGPAYIQAAYIYRALDKISLAEMTFFKFIELDRTKPYVFQAHADYIISFQAYTQAILDYEAAFTMALNLKYPDDYIRQLYFKMQFCFLNMRHADEAREYLNDGEKRADNRPEAMFIRAEIMRIYDEVKDSASILIDNQLDNNWDNQLWLELAAGYYSRTNNHKQAIRVYQRLLELPYPKESYFAGLLDVCLKTENGDPAAEFSANIPYRFQNSRKINERLYDLYDLLNEPDKLALIAEKLYSAYPRHTEYVSIRAELYAQKGKMDQAIEIYDKFFNRYPDDVKGLNNRGKLEYDYGDPQKSLVHFHKALDFDSSYSRSLENIGFYFHSKDNRDSAAFYFNRALLFRADHPLTYYYLALYDMEQNKQLPRAANLAMAAARYFDGDRRGYLLYGQILMIQKKYSMAKQQFFKGLKLHPDDGEYHLLMAEVLILLDDKKLAQTHIDSALKTQLSDELKQKAQELKKKL